MGFVLDLGDGSLRLVFGFLTHLEKDKVVVAISPGILWDPCVDIDCRDLACELGVSFGRETAGEVADKFAEWKKVAQFDVGPSVNAVLRLRHKEDYDAKRADANRLVSAASKHRLGRLIPKRRPTPKQAEIGRRRKK